MSSIARNSSSPTPQPAAAAVSALGYAGALPDVLAPGVGGAVEARAGGGVAAKRTARLVRERARTGVAAVRRARVAVVAVAVDAALEARPGGRVAAKRAAARRVAARAGVAHVEGAAVAVAAVAVGVALQASHRRAAAVRRCRGSDQGRGRHPNGGKQPFSQSSRDRNAHEPPLQASTVQALSSLQWPSTVQALHAPVVVLHP